MIKKNQTRNTQKRRLPANTPPRPIDIDRIPEPELPSTTTKVINKLVVGALIAIAVALGVFFYWASADEKIFTVNNEPFPVRTIREHPTAGGVVLLNVDLCKNTDSVGTARTSFVSSSREIFLPIADERMPKGCLVREIPVVLPNDIPPDTYKVRFVVTYNLNPLKQGVTDEFESKEFEVDPTTR